MENLDFDHNSDKNFIFSTTFKISLLLFLLNILSLAFDIQLLTTCKITVTL